MTKTLETLETQQDDGLTSALDDISSELFGQGSEEDGDEADDLSGEGEPAPVEAKEPPASVPEAEAAAAPPQDDNTAEVQETGAPKTWTKDALAEWATVPPRVQQEILKREEDYFRGISQYKDKAEVGQRYDAVVEPYRPILASENIDPVQLFQSFAANHYLLTRGTPEQKLQLATSMIMGYGIDFQALAEHIGSQGLDNLDPEIVALRREIDELKQGQTARQQQEYQQAENSVLAEVQAFAADPAHPYFNELVDDIHKLMNSGLAPDLQTAYDKAVFANPTTREKEIARLTAGQPPLPDPEKTLKDKIARATAADVTTTPTSRNGTVPVGSMDDTLTQTLASIQNRG